MSLGPALLAAQQLRDTLVQEVKRSKDARLILRGVNTSALFDYAASREAFNTTSARLSAELTAGIAAVARDRGLDDVSVEQLKALYPNEGEELARCLGQLKSLAAALHELDTLNNHLAERALAIVRAYVNHVTPPTAAYTRFGRPPATETTTLSEHA